jgi:N-methylhydantoinase B/oxoprolinase/acetone carboxylase alpha subunit
LERGRKMAAPHWKELLEWIKPEKANPQELEWAEKINPGEYEVFSEKLNNICLEGKEIFIRSGISAMLRSGDLIVGIYTSEGDMVTSYCGTYLHSVTAQLPIKYIMKNFKDDPAVGVNDGDIFYHNEVLYGGIHNPDQIAIMPVFHNGDHIAWTASAVHQFETGATEPGGMCPGAKSRYDEGMKLSPIKIGRNFQIHNDMLEMMANMVGRAPRMQVTDVKARVTAADRVRRRIVEVADEKGKEFIVGLFRKIIIQAEEGARQRIRSWNDGTYRVVVFSEPTGPVRLRLIRFFLTMYKNGDRLIFDFTGTSPENNSSWHAFPHAAVAHAAIYIYSYPFSDLPISSGTFVPMEWKFPEGTILNPSWTAATSNSPPICGTVLELMPLVFSKAMFDSEMRSQVAASIGITSGCVYSGMTQWGMGFSDSDNFELNTMGHGARPDMDGVDAYGFAWCHPGRAPDAEDDENEYPLLVIGQRLLKDSCGFGKFRGGAGGERIVTVHHVPNIIYGSLSCGCCRIFVGQGLFGGYPPSVAPFIRITQSDFWEKIKRGDKDIPTSCRELATEKKLKGNYDFLPNNYTPFIGIEGDIMCIPHNGGAAYGDVLERDPDLVMDDIRNEIISHWAAENFYKIVYDRQTLEVDYTKTMENRQKERKNRLRRGKIYQDFEKEWSQKKPKDEILEDYGSWPDAKKVKEIIRI